MKNLEDYIIAYNKTRLYSNRELIMSEFVDKYSFEYYLLFITKLRGSKKDNFDILLKCLILNGKKLEVSNLFYLLCGKVDIPDLGVEYFYKWLKDDNSSDREILNKWAEEFKKGNIELWLSERLLMYTNDIHDENIKKIMKEEIEKILSDINGEKNIEEEIEKILSNINIEKNMEEEIKNALETIDENVEAEKNIAEEIKNTPETIDDESKKISDIEIAKYVLKNIKPEKELQPYPKEKSPSDIYIMIDTINKSNEKDIKKIIEDFDFDNIENLIIIIEKAKANVINILLDKLIQDKIVSKYNVENSIYVISSLCDKEGASQEKLLSLANEFTSKLKTEELDDMVIYNEFLEKINIELYSSIISKMELKKLLSARTKQISSLTKKEELAIDRRHTQQVFSGFQEGDDDEKSDFGQETHNESKITINNLYSSSLQKIGDKTKTTNYSNAGDNKVLKKVYEKLHLKNKKED